MVLREDLSTGRGTFTSAHELLDRLRARQVELGLSNAELDDICGWTGGGVVDKYLGPSRTKWPGMDVVFRMMFALGLSGELVVDAAKVKYMTSRWEAAGKRKLAAIRIENPRISQDMVKRARPIVLNELRSRGGKARWDGISVEERSLHGKRAIAMRWERRKRENTS